MYFLIFSILFPFIHSISPYESCLSLPNALCINGGLKNIIPDNYIASQLGFWSFDDAFSYDPINKNPIIPPPMVGPSKGGKGYSAFFDGNYFSNITHLSLYETQSFTLEFWLFLLKESTGTWRTIIHKGDTIRDMTPTIMLWPKERRLHVRVSTDIDPNEGLDSKSSIPLKRWTHISVGFEGQLLQLIINGIKDTEIILKGSVRHNKGNFHIGKDPWHQGTFMYMDSMRFWGKLLGKGEIKAITGMDNALWNEGGTRLDSINM